MGPDAVSGRTVWSQVWRQQRMPATEIQRGGAAVWPQGAPGLFGDALGPVMHLHDDASEIFYFIAGRCRLEIGNSQEFFDPGDFVLIPPAVPHNLWNAGDADLLTFLIVAPNVVTNKWRTDNFPPGAMDRRAVRGRVHAGTELPSDANITSRLLTLPARDRLQQRTAERQETILYIVEGEVQVQVGKLGGRLAPHDFVHVPIGTAYAVTATDGPAALLRFEMEGR
jgi:mannose-6-phosphate isomerase-like protein (cupin superfamily)